MIWVCVYLLSLRPSLFFPSQSSSNWNISGIGCVLLVLLFRESASFSESITLKKYPDYAQYQKHTSKFLPITFTRIVDFLISKKFRSNCCAWILHSKMELFSSVIGSQPRGLYNFISEIKDATGKDDERRRVDQELANIRQKFTSTSTLTSYQKKKYVWKMCYIYVLGYDIDFGHMECISLLSSPKYQEKSVGYMAINLLLRPGDDLMSMATNSIRVDLNNSYLPGNCLALTAVANIGGVEFAEGLRPDIQRLMGQVVDGGINFSLGGPEMAIRRSQICKKASLALLRCFRANPEAFDEEELASWVSKIARLLEDSDLGIVVCGISLLLGFASHNPAVFEPIVPYIVSVLTRLIVDKVCNADHLYYRTPCPWAQVKALRFLQYFKMPESTQMTLLSNALNDILCRTEISESVNKSNCDHSILFEAVNLVISYGTDANTELKENVARTLGRFISLSDPNIKYLGLDAMTRMCKVDGPDSVHAHLPAVLEGLRDTDVSIRKRALELLYTMTTESNATEIVGELVLYLSVSEPVMKEETVVKIAILAEKYSVDLQWYIDTMTQVVLLASDYVAEAVWHRIVQMVTNNSDIHAYTAEKMLAIAQNKSANEVSISLSGYLLGEIGVHICERPGMGGYEQFVALHQHFINSSHKVQTLLLTTYMKLVNLYPDIREMIFDVFRKYATSNQLEIQQRACEYLSLALNVSTEIMENALNQMPNYATDKENRLLSLVDTENKGTTDRSAWSVDKDSKEASRAAALAKKSFAAPGVDMDRRTRPTTSHSSSTATGPSHAPTTPAPAPVAFDLLGDDFGSASGGGGVGGAIGIPASAAAQVKSWLLRAMVAPPGSKSGLFDDELVQITFQGDYRAHQARFALNLKNKTGTNIDGFRVTQSSLVDGLNFKIQDVPSLAVIPSQQESRLQILCDCMKPFSEIPSVDVHFKIGSAPYAYRLMLPVSPFSFSEPVACPDRGTYMTRWQSMSSPPQLEAQEIFTSGRPINPELMTSVRNNIFSQLHISRATELDAEGSLTATGCSSMKTGTLAADGASTIAVGIMLRLEGDASQNRFRLTVRTKHPSTTLAVKEAIKIILG